MGCLAIMAIVWVWEKGGVGFLIQSAWSASIITHILSSLFLWCMGTPPFFFPFFQRETTFVTVCCPGLHRPSKRRSIL